MKRKKKTKMKKIFNVIKLIFLLFLILASIFVFDIFIKKQNVSGKTISIKKNQKVSEIYRNLGINYGISDKLFFKYTNQDKYIKTGDLTFDKNLTKRELVNLLKTAKFSHISLTIPEGFTSDEVLNRIESLGLATKKQMLEEMKNYDFYYNHNEVFEGYLYPETYYFNLEQKPKEILDTILNHFLEKYPIGRYDKDDFYEKLIMASIIEKEAKLDEDRDKVAAVFYNRLKINMPLQSDATLKYELKRNVYKKDLLNSNSKYNTYKHRGLTPSPISNPSEKSINAAMNPAKVDYLYFFMYNNKTYYSKTHSEHLRKRKESGHIK